MNGALVQEVAAFLIVGAAFAWLVVRRVRRKAKPTPYCGDCPSCEEAKETPAPASGTLIPVGDLTRGE